MMEDPRDRLPKGKYRATVVEYLDGAIHYTIEGCGDWRYRMTEREMTEMSRPFWDRVKEVGSFTIEVGSFGEARAVDWSARLYPVRRSAIDQRT